MESSHSEKSFTMIDFGWSSQWPGSLHVLKDVDLVG